MKTDITFAGVTVKPGEKVTQYITMAGTDYQIPVGIFNGIDDGKKMLITASIHGFEYPGIQTTAELLRELEPKELKGAVIIVPIVNASAFYGRQPYVCPDDEKRQNLNKLAPGRPDGTFGERLIYYMEEEFVKKCDFHLDLHSGDATEKLLRFCAAGNSQNEEIKEMVHQLMHHLTFEYHTHSSGVREFYNGSALYAGVASMMFECGGFGSWNREEIEFEKDNIRRIMQFLDIVPGKPERNPEHKCIKRQAWIECQETGFFYSFAEIGDDIKKGQKLYEIRDVWGQLLTEYFAEFDGKLFIMNHTLGVTKGDDACFYGSVEEHLGE